MSCTEPVFHTLYTQYGSPSIHLSFNRTYYIDELKNDDIERQITPVFSILHAPTEREGRKIEAHTMISTTPPALLGQFSQAVRSARYAFTEETREKITDFLKSPQSYKWESAQDLELQPVEESVRRSKGRLFVPVGNPDLPGSGEDDIDCGFYYPDEDITVDPSGLTARPALVYSVAPAAGKLIWRPSFVLKEPPHKDGEVLERATEATDRLAAWMNEQKGYHITGDSGMEIHKATEPILAELSQSMEEHYKTYLSSKC